MNAEARFRAAVRRERESRGLNRSQFGELIRRKRQWVGRLEDGPGTVTLTTVQVVADGLGVDPLTLLGDA